MTVYQFPKQPPSRRARFVHDITPPTGLLHLWAQLAQVIHTARHDDDPTRAYTPMPAPPNHPKFASVARKAVEITW